MKIENASNTVSGKSPVHGPRYRNLTLGSTSLAVEVNTNLVGGKSGCEEAKSSKDLELGITREKRYLKYRAQAGDKQHCLQHLWIRSVAQTFMVAEKNSADLRSSVPWVPTPVLV